MPFTVLSVLPIVAANGLFVMVPVRVIFDFVDSSRKTNDTGLVQAECRDCEQASTPMVHLYHHPPILENYQFKHSLTLVRFMKH